MHAFGALCTIVWDPRQVHNDQCQPQAVTRSHNTIIFYNTQTNQGNITHKADCSCDGRTRIWATDIDWTKRFDETEESEWELFCV